MRLDETNILLLDETNKMTPKLSNLNIVLGYWNENMNQNFRHYNFRHESRHANFRHVTFAT